MDDARTVTVRWFGLFGIIQTLIPSLSHASSRAPSPIRHSGDTDELGCSKQATPRNLGHPWVEASLGLGLVVAQGLAIATLIIASARPDAAEELILQSQSAALASAAEATVEPLPLRAAD